MSRTSRYKLLYVAVIAFAGVGGTALWIAFDLGITGLLVFALVLLAVPRIAGHFLRDLFLSRRYAAAMQFEDSKAAAERFLDTLEREPWRRHLIYVFFGFYTWNVRAMALTNLGAAEMGLGNLDAADARFREALRYDEQNPFPYYNLAITAAARENSDEADRMLARSKELGYERGISDQMISHVGTAYSRYQSWPE